ncbi:hypothetical protein C8R43DRAFT_311051 [Mycena crocata]|nr:hypothetical protein C8R43DRAFT_311051 [Mycena crocata]
MAPGATTPTTAITGIRADLLKQKTIPVKDFFRIILDVSEGVTEDLLSLGADQNLRRLLENYDPSNITHETELYRPFVELANSRLDNLSGQEIRLVRNDPKIVLGSAAARKPDLATISSTSLLLGERDSPDNLAENGPAHSFHWLELVGFWEFKWLGRKLSSRAPAISRKTTRTAPRSTKSTSPAATPSSSRITRRQHPTPIFDPRLVSAVSGDGIGRASGSSSRSASDTSPCISGSGSKRASDEIAIGSSSSKRSKQAEDLDDADPLVQCASYALELMSHGGIRTHVISLFVTNSSLELLYFDHSCIIKSEAIDLKVEDHSLFFLQAMSAVASLTPQQWGYHPLFPSRAPKPPCRKEIADDYLSGVEVQLQDHTSVTLGNILFMAHGLIGRGTCVLHGSRNNTAVIVKVSWPSKSRIIEASIIRSVIEHAEKSERWTWVLQHLPSFLHDEQHEHRDKSPQSRLLAYLGADLYESRILRISIQEVLQPIVELTTPTTVVKAFRDIFNAYRWLYEQLKIMYRDVSLANLMFRIGKEGTVLGVLNDFDLAVYVEASGLQSTSRHRMGTRPFMARDLLQPATDTPQYVYRYDLESIYYCILLLTSSYDGGKKIPKSPLDQWFQASPSELLNFKSCPIPPLPTKTFYSVRLWTVGLCDMFAKGDGARGEHRRADIVAELMKEEEPAPFDDETLGGVVTFEKFAAILALEIK